MSFELTSKSGSISVLQNRYLVATVQKAGGIEWVDAKLDLNTCLGNNEGMRIPYLMKLEAAGCS